MRNTSEREEGALDLALGQLREMIVAGVLLPGEQIRQQEVADQLGVSRVPLREALNVLARQGLLLHRPHQGYFVAKRLPMELAQVRRMLQLLEDELLKSMSWPDDACLAELEGLNAAMTVQAQRNDWMGLLPLNRSFHFRVFQLSPYNLILDRWRACGIWPSLHCQQAGPARGPYADLRGACPTIDALRRRIATGAFVLNAHRASTVSGPYDLKALPSDSGVPSKQVRGTRAKAG